MITTSVGQQAETAAAEYLTSSGFTVIERNYRTPRCEIDIILRRGNCVYFVEVKYRHHASQGSGLDYITGSKLRRMQFAAESWMQARDYTGEAVLSGIEVSGSDFQVGELIESITL